MLFETLEDYDKAIAESDEWLKNLDERYKKSRARKHKAEQNRVIAITNRLKDDGYPVIIYKENLNNTTIQLPNHNHLAIGNDNYNPFDNNTFKFALSHSFRTPLQNLEKTLKKAMTIKSNTPIVLQDIELEDNKYTFTITKKG